MEHLISLEAVLRFLLRQRTRILTGLAATVAAVLLLTLSMTPIYEATSLLLVKFGREYLYRPQVGDRDAIPNPARDRQTSLNTELQILRSRDLYVSVVSSLGVKNLYPEIADQQGSGDRAPLMAAVQSFSANLVAQSIKDSDVIRVTFSHTDPEMTAKALNLLVDHFKEKHLLAFSDPQATGFLQEKVAQYGDELNKVEEKLKTLQLDTKSVSSEDQRAGLFQQRRDLEAALKETRNRIAGLEEKLSYLRSEKQKAAGDTGRVGSEQNKAIADARAQLLDLELQEQKLLANFNENSRNVVSVRQQIQLVKDFLERQRAAIGQGEFADDLEKQIVEVVAELRFQQARRDSLFGQVAQLDKDFGRVPEQAAQYRDLIRQREAAEKLYQTYVKKLEEARLSEDMDREKIANISVIQSATVPLKPVWPSMPMNLLVGVVLGIAIGVGWAFVADRLAARGRGRVKRARTGPEEAEWDGSAALVSSKAPVERLALAAKSKPRSLLSVRRRLALATKQMHSLLTQAAGKVTTGDARGSAIALDQAGLGPAPDTQALNRDRDAVAGEEAQYLAPGTLVFADEWLKDASEESERKISLEPEDSKTQTRRVARPARRQRKVSLEPRDAETLRVASHSEIEERLSQRDQQPKGEPAETVDLSSRPAPEPPEAATPAAALDWSVAPASSKAPVERLALASNPLVWAAVALAVLAGGAWLFAVLFEAAPPGKAMGGVPLATTLAPVPSSKLGSEGAPGLAEAPALLEAQKSAEAALEAEKKAAEQKAAENARKRLEARAKAGGRVVDPAALARAQEDERMKARADQERAQQEEMRRLEEMKRAEETLLAEELKRAEEARVADAAARLAAATPTSTMPHSTAPPEPAVKPGQLVSLRDTGVIAPIAQRTLMPPYPRLALRQRVEGTVALNVLVDETGRPLDAQVVTAAGGKTGLNEAALDYVKQWMFRAATKDGVPVKVWYPVKIDFRLPR